MGYAVAAVVVVSSAAIVFGLVKFAEWYLRLARR
jgi:hypothetical protein